MAELVLLKCEVGSKAATVLCSGCGRISRHMLALPYYNETTSRLMRSHTCPVCGAKHAVCSSVHAGSWLSALTRYERDMKAYDRAVSSAHAQMDAAHGPLPAGEEKKKPGQGAEPSWRAQFSPLILKRGETYDHNRQVTVVNRTDSFISGLVQGVERYLVQLSLNKGRVDEMYCSCPFARRGNRCEHEAAMLFAVEDTIKVGTGVRKDDGSARRPTPKKKDDGSARRPAPKKEDGPEKEPPQGSVAPSSEQEEGTVTDPPQSAAPQQTPSDASHPAFVRGPLAPALDAFRPVFLQPPSDDAPDTQANEALERKIERWKRELLDTGKRNRMINFRETKRATLRIVEPEAAELFNKLAFSEKPLTFQKPINRDTDLRTYAMIALMETLSYPLNVQVGDIKTAGTIIEREKTLKNLRAKAKLAQEEQGTNILYLCFGFIYWKEQDTQSAPWCKAPLLMMPVTLGLTSLNAPYTLSRFDDEIQVNPTLDYLFNSEYHIDLPAFELKNRQSFDEYITKIEQLVDRRGWKVTREVSLGLLSFLKISMYHDLNEHHELMTRHPVLRAMAGDSTAVPELPEQAARFDFDGLKPDEWHEVVDADSSQEEAILLSKLGISFVMQGPPGTGKSQTITNIIAEALADGKKILFVSEKAAALEVVLRRLTEVHLDDFCLSLHNYKANKKEIVDSIGANLSLEPEFVDRSALNELTELFHDREYLTKYARDLHRIIEPLGESVYGAFGRLSKLENATALPFRLEDPRAVTRERYASLRYVVEAFEKALRNLGGKLDENVWCGTRAKSSGQTFKRQLVAQTTDLSEKLRAMDETAASLNAEYKTSVSRTWEGVASAVAELDAALALPLFPAWWLDPRKRASLLAGVREERKEQQSFRESLRLFRTVFCDPILDAPLGHWGERAAAIRRAYDDVGFLRENGEEAYYAETFRNRPGIEALFARLKEYADLLRTTEERLGLDAADTVFAASRAYEALELLDRRPDLCEPDWFDPEKNRDGLDLIEAARDHAARLDQVRERIYGSWSQSVLELDLADAQRELRDNPWVLEEANAAGILADQLTTRIKAVETAIEKTKPVLDAYARVTEIFGSLWEDDTFRELRSAADFLRRVSDAPFLEIAWFDTRTCETARPLIREARDRAERIRTLTASVLEKWEPEALRLGEEAVTMLGRFKVEYVGLLHRMKSSYKADMKRFRLLAKEVGRSVDDEEAVALLKTLKELYDEKQWYAQKREQLQKITGWYYHDADTDWNTVENGIAAAAEIVKAFPYGNIPESVIAAIQKVGANRTRGAEARQLAAELSEKTVTECMAAYSRMIGMEIYELTSLQGVALPGAERLQKRYGRLQAWVNALRPHRQASGRMTGRQMQALLDDAAQLRAEEAWFRENDGRIAAYLSDKKDPAADLDRAYRGLQFAAEVIRLFNGSVPEPFAHMLCAQQDAHFSAADRQALREIDGLAEEVGQLTPFAFGENGSITADMMPRISRWLETTEALFALGEEIRPFLASNERPAALAAFSLPLAVRARDMRDGLLRRETELAQLLGDRYTGTETDWAAIEADMDAVERYLKGSRSAATEDFLRFVCDDPDLRATAAAKTATLRDARRAAAPAFDAFADRFEPDQRFETLELAGLADRYDRCVAGFDELNKWLDYVEARADCDAKGLESFTAAVAERNNAVTDVLDAFERGFCQQWLAAVIDDVPAVRSFRRRVHEQRSERFVKLDKKQYEIARRTIRERIIRTYPDLNRIVKAGSELSILRHEMEKKKRIMPLRKLFRSIPDLLLTLKPCLMMSPLSVAYFLGADSYRFDMVIFDEASQIFPQDAIGAICRGKQVIIAGDTNQLPPTNFFAASTSNESEGYDDEEGYDEEVYDSILEETANILPNRTLRWHYRSKHEHLIAFSNQEIYKNNLVTFPSSNESEPDTGVEFVYVEDGCYEPAPRNYNLPEARRIVELVRDHIEKHPERSLGVIAFSEKQQQAIALEIQRFREKNAKYEAFFAEGREDEFFVKNLENVQGDERDTILFSVGYARTGEQKAKGRPMSMRFGPLGIAGGERRLNVAITRAKINVKLVSSILPSDIDLTRTESEGVRMLRAYIEFAMNGEATLAAAGRVGRRDDFVDVVARFLRDQGFTVRQHVGCSGYRIDMAVEHPSRLIRQFVAGVECDGYSYVSAKTARDRDRLRSSVLKGMGWNLYRVWSAEWYKNPEVEGKKLVSFLKAAIDAYDDKVRDLEARKRREEDDRLKAEQEAQGTAERA